MKKYILLFFILWFSGISFAQENPNKEPKIKYILETYNIVKKLNIKGYHILKDVHIFPNPIKDIFYIEFPDYFKYEIYLHDLQSKLIFKRIVNNKLETSFDLTNLKSGSYFLSIIDKENKKAVYFKIQKL